MEIWNSYMNLLVELSDVGDQFCVSCWPIIFIPSWYLFYLKNFTLPKKNINQHQENETTNSQDFSNLVQETSRQ